MEIYGFCNIALIPMRACPSHKSEMVSELLFGEAYQIVEQSLDWVKIITLYDNYEGFIDRNQVALLRESDLRYYSNETMLVAQQSTVLFDKRRNFSFTIPKASSLPLREDKTIYLGAEWFEIKEIYAQKIIKNHCLSLLNAPYLWGGRSELGIDCSGFNQVVYKMMGISLPRDASQQVKSGNPVTINDAELGDLAFFANKEGKITHTGIILDNQTIIHASGKVRIDKIDKTGIYNLEREEYSHTLHSIKRLKK